MIKTNVFICQTKSGHKIKFLVLKATLILGYARHVFLGLGPSDTPDFLFWVFWISGWKSLESPGSNDKTKGYCASGFASNGQLNNELKKFPNQVLLHFTCSSWHTDSGLLLTWHIANFFFFFHDEMGMISAVLSPFTLMLSWTWPFIIVATRGKKLFQRKVCQSWDQHLRVLSLNKHSALAENTQHVVCVWLCCACSTSFARCV